MLAAAAPSVTDDRSERCSNADLKGRYGVATHGAIMGVYDTVNPAPQAIHHYDRPRITDVISQETFDGKGKSTFSYLGFSNGVKFSTPTDPPEQFNTGEGTGTYTVNDDCTGALEVTFGPSSSNTFKFQRAFVLSNNGKTVRMLWTEVHFPFIVTAQLPTGATCGRASGCDLAVQLSSDSAVSDPNEFIGDPDIRPTR